MVSLPQLTTNAAAHSKGLANLSGIQTQAARTNDPDATKEAFQQFVGETFFQMMLKSMRSTHDKPAYLHGGQAEEIFQGQLDQRIASGLAQNAGGSFSDDLFELFRLQLGHPPEQADFPQSDDPANPLNDPVGELAKR